MKGQFLIFAGTRVLRYLYRLSTIKLKKIINFKIKKDNKTPFLKNGEVCVFFIFLKLLYTNQSQDCHCDFFAVPVSFAKKW